MKLAITLECPSSELMATGKGSTYKETHIIEIDDNIIPEDVIKAQKREYGYGSINQITVIEERKS